MKAIRTLFLAGACIGALAFAGCASSDKTAAAGPVNTKCPVSGKPVDTAHTVSYKGQTVGFCCGNCPTKWEAMKDADKDAKLAAAK